MNGKEEKPVETACESYYRILSGIPKIRKEHVGGGANVGMTSKGNVVVIGDHGDTITSYDKDTNDLLRASLACGEGMLVSPLSTNRYTMYVMPDELENHIEAAKQRDRKLNEPEPTRCSIQ